MMYNMGTEPPRLMRNVDMAVFCQVDRAVPPRRVESFLSPLFPGLVIVRSVRSAAPCSSDG